MSTHSMIENMLHLGQVVGLVIEKIIIISIERKDLGGVMSKDILRTLKTVTKREYDTK